MHRAGTRRALWLSWRCVATSFRAQLVYRGNFAFAVLDGVLWQASTMVFIATVLTRFEGLGEFTGRQVMFAYGLRIFTHGLYVVCFDNLIDLSMLIDQGRFEGFLLRPLSPLLQIVTSQFRVHALGDLAVGCTTLAVAAALVEVAWTPATVLYMIGVVVGGVLIEGAIQLLVACLVLRSPGYRVLGTWADEMTSTFGSYPPSIFPRAAQALLFGIVPVAFATYLPARALFHMTLGSAIADTAQACAPLFGLVLFGIAWMVWTRSLRGYQSVGG